MTMPQASAVIWAVFIWAFAVGSVVPTLTESWRLGGHGARHAEDAEVALNNTAVMLSIQAWTDDRVRTAIEVYGVQR